MLSQGTVTRQASSLPASFSLAPTIHGDWRPTSKLTASDGRASDSLGNAVALDGDTLVAGAPDRSEVGFASGAAYVYERDADGSWTEVKVTPRDLGAGDSYDRGSALVPTRWQSVRTTTSLADRFTSSTAIHWIPCGGTRSPIQGSRRRSRQFRPGSDSTGLAKSWRCEPIRRRSRQDAGAVHIFERDAGGPDAWGWMAKLTAPDPDSSDCFAIARSTATASWSARPATTAAASIGAKLRLRARHRGCWNPTAQLFPSDPEDFDGFGYPITLDGDVVAIAAHEQGHRRRPECGGRLHVRARRRRLMERGRGGHGTRSVLWAQIWACPRAQWNDTCGWPLSRRRSRPRRRRRLRLRAQCWGTGSLGPRR